MWKKPLALLGASALICGGEICRELSVFRVRRYRIDVPGMKKNEQIKILFLSDLHGREYGEANRKLLGRIQKENPDCILVGGDMLTRGRPETDSVALDLMRRLPSLAPVYAANGNHEQKMKENTEKYKDRYEKYSAGLKKAGIHILENDTAFFRKGSFQASVTGLEIPLSCYSHFGKEALRIKEIEKRIGTVPEGCYHILLAHNPSYVEQYWKWGADLVLSGHLHGGVVRLPFLGGVITPQMQLFPKYSGDMYKKDGHRCVVSRGLGTHTVNVRLYNMAELVCLVFTGE